MSGVCSARGLPAQAHVIPAGSTVCTECHVDVVSKPLFYAPWYRLPEPREPLEWELLRALARPSSVKAAQRFLDGLCPECAHFLVGWFDWFGRGTSAWACANPHCRLGRWNGRAYGVTIRPTALSVLTTIPE